jgi:hypothetical protein
VPHDGSLQHRRLALAGSGGITDQEMSQLLLDVREAAELLALYLGEQRALGLFRVAGFLSDTGEPVPTVPITAHRGGPWSNGWRGFPWTRDAARARWFANRHALDGRVAGIWELAIPPEAILALITGPGGRRKNEVVVNPRRLPRSKLVLLDQLFLPDKAGADTSG